MSDEPPKSADRAEQELEKLDQSTPQLVDAPDDISEEQTRGWCGWEIFAPQKETWIGFAIAWLCVLGIIFLTWVFAKIGS